jgi:glycosyltransferase involved in cell wall biosynthesis
MPFFSVIIPSYNRADLICKTIDSVLNQTYDNFEIIVVDNKSTDDTVKRLQPYVDKQQIRLYVQERNYERAKSRNRGFDEAKGKFVTLLDSDDVLYPQCLEKARQYFDDDPKVRFFHTSYEVFDEEGSIISKGSLEAPKNPFKALASGNYISNIGVFFDAADARDERVDETPVLIGTEDYDFVLRMLHRINHIGFIPGIYCGVLNHPQRTVLTQDMQRIEDRVHYFVDKSIHGNIFTGSFAPYKKNFLSGNQLYLCGAAAIRGLSRKAFRYWLKAARDQASVVFTIKYWKHLFVILKYMFR